MKFTSGTVASIGYRVTLDDGHVIDQVLSDEPLEVLHGSQALLPEIAERLDHRAPGDSFTCRLERPIDRAPSARRGHLVVPRELLPAGFVPTVGAALQADGAGGTLAVWVREVRPDAVVLDPHHPLSGLALNVQVWVFDVRPATPAELAPLATAADTE